MNGYTVSTGFQINYEQQLNYNKLLANEAHALGMMAGLKNDNEQAKDLVSVLDFAVLEVLFFKYF